MTTPRSNRRLKAPREAGRPRGLWVDGPDSVVESGQEAGGNAESWVQEVFFLRWLQRLQVCVKLL